MKTNFSFEVQLPVQADGKGDSQPMKNLSASLNELFTKEDSAAKVMVSDSHKGPDHKLVELVTSIEDAKIQTLLADFSSKNGLDINALE